MHTLPFGGCPFERTPMTSDRSQTSHRVGHDAPASGTAVGASTTARMSGVDPVRTEMRPAKTSAAAVFALVFGLSALFCALTGILSPAAVLFGLIGIVLGVVGLKMAKRVGVTGKGVALGGLVTAVLGLLLGGAVLGGLAALVNDERQLDRLQNRIDDLRTQVPSTDEVRSELPS